MSFDLRPKQNRRKVLFAEHHQRPARFDQQKTVDHGEEWISNEQIIPNNIGEIIHKWQGLEFEVYEKSARWYFVGTAFIFLLVAYALYSNSPIMAITFILIGIVGYIYSQKDPRTITFAITSKGVLADKELYFYDNINSFWIFYEHNHSKVISLHTKASMLPYVHIPIGDEDPVEIREALVKRIPEIKQDPGLIDALERFLHI